MPISKKHQTIPIDQSTYEAMNSYAATYGLSLSDLVNRMWGLWSTIEKTRDGLMPAFSPLQESLDAFMAEMQRQADTLDEDYINLDREYEATQARNQAIATYQTEHPFIADSDDTMTICPSCKKPTTKAGLVYLETDIRCDACYTLPNTLQQYRENYPESE